MTLDDLKIHIETGRIPMLEGYDKFTIGSFYRDGLYRRKIFPDADSEELPEWIKERQQPDN
ncbi:hypothetical protein [Ruminococcus sp.]|uniref:hypothetical protein n=1 Tax=Ruminococcus sp. TaxID=41978 RepID=UPI0025DC0E5F|nr:hypothetical protein [Ruminococcus sp.]MBQ8967755.1 hypothetical protein [Ruminococcus sp.]